MKHKLLLFIALLPVALFAQQRKDSTKTISLEEIIVNKIKTVRGTGYMPHVKDGIIYAAKKNESYLLIVSMPIKPSITQDKFLEKISGLNIVESEKGGSTANEFQPGA